MWFIGAGTYLYSLSPSYRHAYCAAHFPSSINIKQLKQAYASSAVLIAEQKGQEIIIVKTFLKKVSLIQNYINHLEEKKYISIDVIRSWAIISFSFKKLGWSWRKIIKN